MTVACLFFAHYQDVVGEHALSVTVGAGATVHDLALALQQTYPDLGDLLDQGRAAVDAEFAQDGTPLHEGAEVAWMPPMSGGSLRRSRQWRKSR